MLPIHVASAFRRTVLRLELVPGTYALAAWRLECKRQFIDANKTWPLVAAQLTAAEFSREPLLEGGSL